MLREGIDRSESLVRPRQRPVLTQLILMKTSPLNHEPQRTWWQPAIDHLKRVDRDLRDMPAVPGVEVRRRMVTPVHRYDDAVEGRDPRRRAIVEEPTDNLPATAAHDLTALRGPPGRAEHQYPYRWPKNCSLRGTRTRGQRLGACKIVAN